MQNLTVSMVGFPPANREAIVELRNSVTGDVVRTAKPFLDGTVRVPQIEAGVYELAVRHPNLTLPVLTRPIRVLPVGDTNVSVVIDPAKFRNTPIEDIPDANLAPVQDAVRSVADTVAPLAAKVPGEAILAQDWNAMASAIRDLAEAVSELTRLVSPIGHSHPELEKKLAEMQGNFDELVSSVSASLTELQRQIQTQRFRSQIFDVLGKANVDPASDKGKAFTDLVSRLEANSTASPLVFGREARNAGVQLSTKLEALLDEQSANPEFAGSDAVKGLSTSIDLLKQQRATDYSAELQNYRKVDRVLGGGALRIGR
jgi:hypothetical protein